MNVARAKASRHRAVSPWLVVFILHRQICHSFRIPLQGQFFPLICYPPPLDKNESCQAQDTGFELEMPFGTRSLASAKSPQLLKHKDDEQTEQDLCGDGQQVQGPCRLGPFVHCSLVYSFLPLWRATVDQKEWERSVFQTTPPEGNVGKRSFSVYSERRNPC